MLLILLVGAGAAFGAQGTGTATVTPPGTVPARTQGTWTFEYTAVDTFKTGRITLTIPALWTTPQPTTAAAEGYVTASSTQPGLSVTPVVGGNVVTVLADTLTPGNTITIVYGNTQGGANPGAVATAPTAPTTAEFTVASDSEGSSPTAILLSPTLQVVPAAPDHLDIVPASQSIVAGAFEPYTITVRDQYNNATAVTRDRTVNVFTSNGSFYPSGNTTTPIPGSFQIPNGQQSVTLDYRSTLSTPVGVPHTIAMTTLDGPPQLSGNATVDVVAAAVNVAQSTLVATSGVIANGVNQSNATVTARDAFGNRRPAGDTVTLSAPPGSRDIVPPSTSTGLAGEASFVVTNTVAETILLSATINGQLIDDTAGVTFIAGGVSADSSTVSAWPNPRIANGTDPSTITVTARDAQGNPVANQSVALSVEPAGGGVVLTQPGGVTNASGQITGTLSSTTTGPRTVRATIGATTVVDSAVVTFIPGTIASIEWSTPPTGTAGQIVDVSITIRDASNNLATNYAGTIDLSTTSAGTDVDWTRPEAPGSIVNGAGDAATLTMVAGDGGVANLRVTNTRAESYQLNASDSVAPVSAQSQPILVGHGSAAAIALVTGSGQFATVDNPVSVSPRVRVTDTWGNLVNGESVTFRAVGGGGSVDVTAGGAPDDSTGLTDVTGELAADVWTLGTLVGTNTLRALITALPATSVDFTATGTPDVGANLVLDPTSKNVTVNGTETVTATLTDQHTNPVSGERVDILIKAPASGTLSASAYPTTETSPTSRFGITDAAGQISVVFNATSTAPVIDAVDAFTLDVPQSSVVDAVYTTVTSGATNLRISYTGGPTSTAGTAFPIKIDAIDGDLNIDPGNSSPVTLVPELGSNLEFSLTDFGATITQVTLSAGTATIYGRTVTAGAWELTTQAPGLSEATEEIDVTDTGTIASYGVTAPASANAGATFNVTVTARDPYGNRVMGATNNVNLEPRLDSNPTLPGSGALSVTQTTLVAGRSVVPETYDTAESIQVRASDGSSNEGFSGTLQVANSAAYRIAYVSGTTTGVTAGADQALVVQVFDAFDNPVAGVDVTFDAFAGGGSVPPGPSVTNASGLATTTLTTGTTVGINTAAATILDGTPPSLEQTDFVVETVAGPVAGYSVTPVKTALKAGETTNVNVAAYDANSNLVVLDNTTPIDITTTGTRVALGDASGQLVNGTFQTTVADSAVGTFTVSVQTQAGVATGTSPTISVTNESQYRVVYVAGNNTGVTVGGTQLLELEVQDPFGNVVPGALVTFFETPPGGIDGSAFVTDTDGDPNDGLVSSNGAGRATATLHTALTAGDNLAFGRILDGAPPALERVAYTVSTVAAGIDHYEVDMGTTSETAGVPVGVTVRARDTNNNLVDDSSTLVTLALDLGTGPPVWGTNPAVLEAGTLVTDVTLTRAETVRIQADSPGATGVGDDVLITPDVPAGLITATASADTITANGLAMTQITSGVITDQFGNQVPAGEKVTISASDGTITTPDQDGGLEGNQQLVDGAGRVTAELRAGLVQATSSVNLSTLSGAFGSIDVVFAPQPIFNAAFAPSPSSVILGQKVAFQAQLQNTSTTDVTLYPSTEFFFDDFAYEAFLAAPTFVGGGETVVLQFDSVVVSSGIQPASYQPFVALVGVDQYGESFTAVGTLPSASLQVSAIEILGITGPGILSRGQTGTFNVSIENPGPTEATINTVILSFPTGVGSYDPQVPLNLPLAIPPGGTANASIDLPVSAASPTGVDQVDAFVQGTVNGSTVQDGSLLPNPLPTLTIQTAAELAYEPGTLSPTKVSRGDAYAFQLGIRNNGDATVTLTAGATELTFTDGPRTYTASLSGALAIAGSSMQMASFQTQTVPAAFSPGSWDVTVNVVGTENGAAFNDTISTGAGGDLLQVVTPANVSYGAGSLQPTTVSKGGSYIFQLNLANAGGASVVLDPANTTLSFGPGQLFTAQLDPNGATVLGGNLTTPVQFDITQVSNSIPQGPYNPTVHLEGTENGNPFAPPDIVLSDAVTVQDAPSLQLLQVTRSQPTYTADQAAPITVTLNVQNNGGAPVDFVAASIRFILGGIDRSSQFTIAMQNPGQFDGGPTLGGGGTTETITFDVSDAAGSMSVGNMTIEADLEVVDPNTSQPLYADNLGSLLVQTRADLQILAVLPELNEVTQGMDRDFVVRVPVGNAGQSDVDLTLAALNTMLEFTPPGGWVSTVRPQLASGGTLLAGGDLDTLLFDVTTSGSVPGPNSVDAVVAGIETNSGRTETGGSSGQGLGTIDVQTPGTITVSGVSATRATITNGSPVTWDLVVDLQNMGQSDIDLDLAAMTASVTGASPAVPRIMPTALEVAGGMVLAGNTTDQLIVRFTESGNYTSFGTKTASVFIVGTDVNSLVQPLSGTGNTTIEVQSPPNPIYLPSTLAPAVVSRGTSAEFQIDVRNAAGTSGADIVLDLTQTRLRFGGGLFSVAPAGPVSIAGGDTESILFEGGLVGPSIPLGAQGDVQAELHWTENGRAQSAIRSIPSADLTVQAAPQLSILSITPSRAASSVGQGPWTVAMALANAPGGAPINLDLADTSTFLRLTRAASIVTGEYQIGQPAGLESAGGTVLAGGETDTLVFTIDQTGTSTGIITIGGEVAGIDLNSSLPVGDNTLDGGTGSFTLEEPAALQILSITPARATATVGQTSRSYLVRMAVRNNGDADADLTLDNVATRLNFSAGAGWNTSLPFLAGGGTVLGGGEVDTVTFRVVQTGGSAGNITIAGAVQGTESNLLTTINDDTGDGGSGSILVQTQAQIVLTAVTPSEPAVTSAGNRQWSIEVGVRNFGGSAAELQLPGSLVVDISGDAILTQFGPVNALDGGGTILGPGDPGTFTIPVTQTGTFSAFGPRLITVAVTAEEQNSGVIRPSSGATGSVVVQKAAVVAEVPGTIDPDVVSKDSNVAFQVDVANADPDAATAVLDRAKTRLSFNGGAYSAVLDPTSPDTVAAGAPPRTLLFERKLVDVPEQVYNVSLDLYWDANSEPDQNLRVIPNGVEVQAAPALQILSIVPEQSTVTVGQITRDWDVTMRVKNNGGGIIDLDLTRPNTDISFDLPGGGADATYLYSDPVGPDTLAGTGQPGDTGVITFTVSRAGNTAGAITINGTVRGVNRLSSQEVLGDTFLGGRGNVTVERPADIVVTDIVGRQTVTAGQTVEWLVRVDIENQGEAEVDIDTAATDIAFTPPAGWSNDRATELVSGGTLLPGGARGSLQFRVTQTSSTPGVSDIAATVTGIETNSDRIETSPPGAGSVLVQLPPSLDVRATELIPATAPNRPNVNQSQPLQVAVQIKNTGEATANNVEFRLDGGTAGAAAQPAWTFPSIPGDSVRTHVFDFTAAPAPPGGMVTAKVDSALDANTSLVFRGAQSGTDSTEAVVVQAPAIFAIDSVTTSRSTVTQGQSTPWDLVVHVSNAGGAAIDITPPSSQDIRFVTPIGTANDYIVQAPTDLGGRAGLRLAGADGDSLRYTVIGTGNTPGAVAIEATIDGTDINDTSPLTATRNGVVTVEAPAGLYVAETTATGTYYGQGSRRIVNTGFVYAIDVKVKNTGEAVDQVVVALTSDDGSGIALQGNNSRSIEANDSTVYTYQVTAPGIPVPLERFTSRITGAISRNTQQPVDPQQAVDAVQLVETQTPADLDISFSITDPPGSVGGNVSPTQLFTVTAVVTNTGTAGIDETGATVALDPLPAGFSINTGNPVQAFALDAAIEWILEAPTLTGAHTLTARIDSLPRDINNNLNALATPDSANLAVTVSEGGGLASPTIEITTPYGARDNTLSTAQSFRVRVATTPSSDTRNVSATLSVPSGFTIVGAPTTPLETGTGDGTARFDSFLVTTPAGAAGPQPISVQFDGFDVNSGDPVSTGTNLNATVVTRADLSVDAYPENNDNTVSPGEPFTVTATVTNAGVAGVDASGVVSIQLPTGYTTGTAHDVSFAVGVPVVWRVIAPNVAGGPDLISVSISTAPRDENDDAQPGTATVSTGSVQIPMVTEGASVIAVDATDRLGLDTKVVPGGETGVRNLAFDLEYRASDTNAGDARIDAIGVTVLGANGQPLSDSNVQRSLARLFVEIRGQTYEQVDPSQNPVLIPVAAGGSLPVIEPDSILTVVGGLDVRSSPSVEEIRLQVLQSGFDIVDTISDQALVVYDAQGNPLNGQLRSQPLVLLSSNFEEYAHNYPNPFRAGSQTTAITYLLDQASDVQIRIYDLTGDLVYEQQIAQGQAGTTVGSHEAEWDGRNGQGEVVRNGLYVCVINAAGKSAKFRIAVAK